jgi:hypothetical protein
MTVSYLTKKVPSSQERWDNINLKYSRHSINIPRSLDSICFWLGPINEDSWYLIRNTTSDIQSMGQWNIGWICKIKQKETNSRDLLYVRHYLQFYTPTCLNTTARCVNDRRKASKMQIRMRTSHTGSWLLDSLDYRPCCAAPPKSRRSDAL